jgi:hypothetical protein
MLYFKDVPVVIEPGVAALEVAIVSNTDGQPRLFFVPFMRVEPNSSNAENLPLIISSTHPHIFTMHEDLAASPFLLVYDMVGKLAIVYTRDPVTRAWERNDAAPEQVGNTITQFSVRFSFNSVNHRARFLRTLDELTASYTRKNKLSRKKVESLLEALLESNVGPVILPVAVAKPATV